MVFGYFAQVSGGMVEFQSEAHCSMETRAAKNAMRQVPSGTYIVMAGEGDGHVFRMPWIDDCRLLDEDDELYVPEGPLDSIEPVAQAPSSETTDPSQDAPTIDASVESTQQVSVDPEPQQAVDQDAQRTSEQTASRPEVESPEVQAEAPEPMPAPEPERIEVPAGWTPVGYKLDGRDTTTMGGEQTHWVYIYLTEDGSAEQMVATAMQAALDTYREHGGDVVLVGIMEEPGAEYPVDIVTFYPKGCPKSKQCSGGVWDNSLTIPATVLANMEIPTREEATSASRTRAAAELARAAARKAQDERNDAQYEQCFNPWNGSHKLLVDLVKQNINTPRSFKHVDTTAYLGEFPRPVVMQFDAQNAFGATVRTTVKAMSDPDCSVVITEVVP